MSDGPAAAQPRKHPLVIWADRLGMAGGFLSLLMGALVTVSVIGRWLFDNGVPGDFEFVKMGTAMTVFFFLPACQAHRGNIVVDTFTGFLSEAARNRIDAVWDVVYGIAMAGIGYCMVLGTWEAYRNGASTMVLQFATWPALAVSTLLVVFLSAVCFWTAQTLRGAR